VSVQILDYAAYYQSNNWIMLDYAANDAFASWFLYEVLLLLKPL
jgi:hypothetical protein